MQQKSRPAMCIRSSRERVYAVARSSNQMKRFPLFAALIALASPAAAAPRNETAVLAGGCFWGMEAVFEHVKGVTDVVSGYAGGSSANAHYDDAASGHAEAV